MPGAPDPTATRRDAILDAAIAVFLRYGFRKTSMDDLARAAGLSRQGLYLHFETKEALFKDAVLRVLTQSRAAARASLERDDLDVEPRLLAAFEAIHSYSVGQPGAEHMAELIQAATSLVGPVLQEIEADFVSDIARVLRSSGVAARWKDLALSARELAEHLCTASAGAKHAGATSAAYRERMRVALRVVCRTPRR
jgi:AcrR family transcriptional regulator